MKEKINGGGQKRGGVAKCNTALSNHLQEHMTRVITTPVKLRNAYKYKDINTSETVPVVVRVRGVGPRFVEEMIEALSCKVTIISPPLSVTEGVTLVKSPQMRD